MVSTANPAAATHAPPLHCIADPELNAGAAVASAVIRDHGEEPGRERGQAVEERDQCSSPPEGGDLRGQKHTEAEVKAVQASLARFVAAK